MKLETDLSKIKHLARVRTDENLDFRAYLKELPFSSRKIDRSFRKPASKSLQVSTVPTAPIAAGKCNPF